LLQQKGTSPIKADDKKVAPLPKKSIWEKVKHEANHYWEGTKLLGYELRISFKLALKSAAGYELTRRENKQLKRTTQDIVRLVPFSMFIIVPFAELLLPVALKLYPNLLPSTYESTADKEKKRSKLLKTRQGVSELLKESVQMKLPSTVSDEQKADFKDFLTKIRSSSEQPSREQLLRVAKLFKDDTVLDNLQRSQLVAVAKYINLQPIGTNQMLTFRIRNKLLNIKRDDKAIYYEGIDSLTTAELQTACGARGIRVSGVSTAELQNDLSAWLNLRLNERIPSTLLVLSNAYTYGDLNSDETIYDALQAVLGSMPEEVYHVTEADVVEEVTNKQRLELIKEQQELIESETKQETEDGIIIQVQDKKNLDDDETPDLVETTQSKEVEKEEAKEKKD
jgi:LETM1 and EF-hand domain-containing protein 1